jgi:tRNA-specific 2-thiouridylase
LARTLFPVGEYEKPKVRELAKKFGLPNANKKDSQGICFIGNIDMKEFLRGRVAAKPGHVVTATGEVVGEHEGLAFYTIGQRKGIGSFGGGIPYYVIGKNTGKNELVVGTAYDENLSADTATIADACWVGEAPQEGKVYTASIRYRQKGQEVRIIKEDEKFVLHFTHSQRAVTEGQSAVVYDSDVLLGGGIIEK